MSILELVTDSLEKPKPQRKPQKIIASAESLIPQAAPLEPSADKLKSMKEEDSPDEETQIIEEASVAGEGIVEEKSATRIEAIGKDSSKESTVTGNKTSDIDVDSKEGEVQGEVKDEETDKT